MFEPWYCPEPKSGCNPTLGPMKVIMASEFASTREAEMSLFQELSLANGRNPLRLAPCPVLIALQALWLLPPEPAPPPDPLPEPLPPLPAPVPPDEGVEPVAPPPQFAHENASASNARAAGNFLDGNFMPLFSPEIAAKIAHSQSVPRRNRDMYYQHLADSSK